MAKTNLIKKSRKEYTCNVCQKPIHKGEPYKFVEPHYMPLVRAHVSCEIPMSMTSSSKMVAIWDAVKAIDTSGDPGDVSSALNDLASTAREVGDEYQEGADNQRQYFPDSEKADESEEKASNLSEWADALEEAASEIDSRVTEIIELEEEIGELEEIEELTQEQKDRLVTADGEKETLELEVINIADSAIEEQPE